MKKGIISLIALGVVFSVPLLRITRSTNDPIRSTPLSTVEENGVSVSLITSEISPSGALVTACIQLPDNQDWLPYASILVGDETINADSMALLNSKDAKTYENSYRCYEFGFSEENLSHSEVSTFIVDRISTSMPEGLTQDMFAEALTSIQSTNPKIDFTCVIDPHGVRFENLSTDPSITESVLTGLIQDELTRTVVGPWRLKISP